ncbi:hypothetical protein QMK61_11225 [Fulvimonas sp. R45]|uniref:hypothetical protein n=1 Tax=Fulvimonas sp. R45 TaxID=3045937 RepID=UPI00265E2A8E|nr:hypothetical protein [Fulvimonas sp. R45]MDO1529400.1 hypothetical protein [Fulvimonas sp. R45]
MDWNELLRLPSTLLLILAALALLLALVQLIAVRQRLRDRRHAAAGGHGLVLLLAFVLALLLAGLGLTLRGYRFLGEELPVAQIDARIVAPQRWVLTLTWPDGGTRQAYLAGDDFRLEAVVLKWKLPALLAGVPPLYRLDRLEGRYDDATQEAQAPRTVLDFGGSLDLLTLKRDYPGWLPELDALYGSGAYLPLVDRGHYTVNLMRTGALVARPDEATAQRIRQPL